jgi:hypothetical protein
MRVRTLLGITASTVLAAIGAATPALATTVVLPATRACVILTPSGGGCGAVGAGYVGTYSPPLEYQGLLQFDLSGIPANAEINSATLSLAITWDPDGIAGSTGLREVAEPWDNHATWLTGDGTNVWGYGAPYNAHGTTDPFSVGPLWVDWDVSGFLYHWTIGATPNYGIRLENYGGDSVVWFEDPSAAHPPKLTIDYTV